MIVFLEYCNFIDYPNGGQLSFARHILSAFGSDVALVGLAPDDKMQIGMWVKHTIGETEYDYFAIGRTTKIKTNHWIPNRVKAFFAITKYQKEILGYPSNNYFIQSPDIFLALFKKSHLNICLRLPGLHNPLRHTRFWYGKYFANIYEYYFYSALNQANLLLATADETSITKFTQQVNRYTDINHLKQFPTRYDSSIFYIRDKIKARRRLKFRDDLTVIITVGRLNKFKGWRFLIDSFAEYIKIDQESIFIFIGDGEDYNHITNYSKQLDLTERIILKGLTPPIEVAEYLGAADMFVMGSYAEGWPNALMEAIVSGVSVCTTEFSSTMELVENGVNGYAVKERDAKIFAQHMAMCKRISKKALIEKAHKLSHLAVNNLKEDLLSKWTLQ
jgi:glycosyltransferase involved in cell wall biosynthesis